MIDWLLKNPQIIIFAVICVIALIGRYSQAQKEAAAKREREMRGGRQTAAPAAQRPRGFDTSAMDADEAERTRRIQEEVRRKILARMGHAQPPPLATRPAPHAPPPLPVEKAQPAQPAYDESANAYRSAMEKLAEMQAAAATANANNDEAFDNASLAAAPAAPAGNNELIAALNDTASLRRAILLREILDKPAGLRG